MAVGDSDKADESFVSVNIETCFQVELQTKLSLKYEL